MLREVARKCANLGWPKDKGTMGVLVIHHIKPITGVNAKNIVDFVTPSAIHHNSGTCDNK